MSPGLPEPVLVIGCGLMGTSVGLALTRAGVDVHLRDLLPAHVELAVSLGAGSAAVPETVGTVVVGVPPDHVAEAVVGALVEWPGAVVTDLSSVKLRPLEAILAAGCDATRYVGGHPMAGSERSGPVAASAALFDGRAWAVTTHDVASDDAVDAVRTLATMCGATVVEMSPADHDAAVAKVSHLPQLMSVLAASQLNGSPTEHLALAGQGLRDVTRIAASDPRLWRQIVAGNSTEIRSLLTNVRDDLDTLLHALGGSPAELQAVLERGVRGTQLIPGKHGAEVTEEATVFVHIPDRPGELARLFADAGESDVNIEDVRIDHDPARPEGLMEVVVRAAKADILVEALTERGWLAYR